MRHVRFQRVCARCTYPLDLVLHPSGVEVDHCRRCGGTFLDWGESGRVLGQNADPSRFPAEIYARPPAPTRLLCPSGHGSMWSYLLAWDGASVEIDACGACHGMWLDANEAERLAEITSHARAERHRPGASKGTTGIVAMYLLQLATSLPVEVYNPVRRRPWLTHVLVGLLPLLFLAEVALVAILGEEALNVIAFVPRYFERGYAHQLVTYAFLHGGLLHVAGNVASLWIFGDNVEDRLGRGRYVVLYLGAAVAGALAHWAGNLHGTEPMVGASGAIAGLMGAYMVLFPRVKLWIVLFFVQFKIRAAFFMLAWLALNLLLAFAKTTEIAWLAHVGGFVVGAVLGKALDPAPAMPARVRSTGV